MWPSEDRLKSFELAGFCHAASVGTKTVWSAVGKCQHNLPLGNLLIVKGSMMHGEICVSMFYMIVRMLILYKSKFTCHFGMTHRNVSENPLATFSAD